MYTAIRTRIWAMCIGCIVVGGGGCSSEAPLAGSSTGAGAVFILGVERLRAPEVSSVDVYVPVFWFDPDSSDDRADRTAGFYMTVAVSDGAAVRMRLYDQQDQQITQLSALSDPVPADPLQEDGTWKLSSGAMEALSRSEGIFWEISGGASGLEHRFAVAIPETGLGSFMTLEVYAAEAPDGAAIGADRVELVRDFFYMAAVGDSVMWGNGLTHRDKFTTRVAEQIEQETGRKVILQNYSISGASLLPPETGGGYCVGLCSGEVPKAYTSVTEQLALVQRPELLELILLDGCANDVGLGKILSGDTTAEDLETLTRQSCHDVMFDVLQEVEGLANHAKIVVNGYYPFFSEQSDLTTLEQWLNILSGQPPSDQSGGVSGGGGQDSTLSKTLEQLITNSSIFYEVSSQSLEQAVADVNAETSPPRAAYADAGYEPANTAFAPDSWIWGLTEKDVLPGGLDLGYDLTLFPEDPLLDYRAALCTDEGVQQDLLTCLYASVLHPNPAGADAYTRAIIAQLRKLGILPAK